MCNTRVDIINGYISGNADAFLFLISLLLIVVDGEQEQPRESFILKLGPFSLRVFSSGERKNVISIFRIKMYWSKTGQWSILITEWISNFRSVKININI